MVLKEAKTLPSLAIDFSRSMDLPLSPFQITSPFIGACPEVCIWNRPRRLIGRLRPLQFQKIQSSGEAPDDVHQQLRRRLVLRRRQQVLEQRQQPKCLLLPSGQLLDCCCLHATLPQRAVTPSLIVPLHPLVLY